MSPRAVGRQILALLILWTGVARARDVSITILHTSDLHGRILPTPERFEERLEEGGLLRCATLIRSVRAEQPNCLLIDCGDTIQGSPESWYTQGRIMLRALEELHYDAWVFGNHEFDWGIEPLSRLHDAARIPLLTGNLTTRPGTSNRFSKARAFLVHEFEGVRVAVIGMTTPNIPRWSRPELLGDVQFVTAAQALAVCLPDVRAARPDILVLALHQGYRPGGDDAANEVNLLTRRFPDVDVILGAHTHQAEPGRLLNGVLYTQAGCHGRFVGRVDLTYDTVRRRLVYKGSRLLPASQSVEEDADLRAALQADLRRTRTHLDRAVGRAAAPLSASPSAPGQSAVQQLLCRAVAEACDAPIVLHNLLARESLEVGVVRRADLWRIVPYENRIGVAELTFGELRELLEENAEMLGTPSFLGVWGVRYDLDLTAPPGQRVSNLRMADDSKPHARKRFRVGLNSYTLASGGGRYAVLRRVVEQPESRFQLMEIDTRSAVEQYVRSHSPLKLTDGSEWVFVRSSSLKEISAR